MPKPRNAINDPSNDVVTIGGNPADFDFTSWIAGVRPNRASVPVYGRPDLADDIQDARRRLTALEAANGKQADRGLDDPTPDSVRAELDDLLAEYEQSKVMFVVEGRSVARREKIRDQLKEQGIEDPVDIGLHLLADAIVEPAGVTVDLLRYMNDTIEPQLSAVATAAQQINQGVPQVSTPFSSRPSGSRTTPTS